MFFTALKTVLAALYLRMLNLFDHKGTASAEPKIMFQGSKFFGSVVSVLVYLPILPLIQLLALNRSSKVCQLHGLHGLKI